jgi:hypothetical protein
MLRCALTRVATSLRPVRAYAARPADAGGDEDLWQRARENVLHVPVEQGSVNPLVLKALSQENASRSDAKRLKVKDTVREFRRSESDTGSPEVQGKQGAAFGTTSRRRASRRRSLTNLLPTNDISHVTPSSRCPDRANTNVDDPHAGKPTRQAFGERSGTDGAQEEVDDAIPAAKEPTYVAVTLHE